MPDGAAAVTKENDTDYDFPQAIQKAAEPEPAGGAACGVITSGDGRRNRSIRVG